MRIIKQQLTIGAMLLLLTLVVPTLVLAGVKCRVEPDNLGTLMQWKTGDLFAITKNNRWHAVCNASQTYAKCRSLQAMLLAAHAGKLGYTLQYAENDYDCDKHYGGLGGKWPERKKVQAVFVHVTPK